MIERLKVIFTPEGYGVTQDQHPVFSAFEEAEKYLQLRGYEKEWVKKGFNDESFVNIRIDQGKYILVQPYRNGRC